MAAFDKTQNKLDELRNLTWQNGKLIEQVEKLTKMLEEKEDSALVVEIEEAKKVLADAINTRGGSASAESSFQQLADDIQTLPYSGISAEGIVQDAPFSFIVTFFGKNTAVTKIVDNEIINTKNTLENFQNLEEAYFGAVKSIPERFVQYNTKVRVLSMPGLGYIGRYHFGASLEFLQLGKISYFNSTQGVTMQKLRNLVIREETDVDLLFNIWTATYVIAEGLSGIDELNNNLRTNLLEKLYDHSEDGQTRTLRLGWLAYVSQENIDYANAKGWTLTK